MAILKLLCVIFALFGVIQTIPLQSSTTLKNATKINPASYCLICPENLSIAWNIPKDDDQPEVFFAVSPEEAERQRFVKQLKQLRGQ